MARVQVKRVYEPAAPGDGRRVLIMRLWPRGVRKSRVHLWLRELGPLPDLMRGFLAGRIPWPEYRRRYLAGLRRPEARAQLAELRALARRGPLTLLCWCPDASRCHRSLLQARLARRSGRMRA